MNYDKEFWNTFIEAYGCNIDGNARMFYLYSSDFDTEEEKVSLKVMSDSILLVTVHETEDDEVDGRKVRRTWDVWNHIRMESITNVQLTSDTKETDLGEVVVTEDDLCVMCKVHDAVKGEYCEPCHQERIRRIEKQLDTPGISNRFRIQKQRELNVLLGVEPDE